MYMKNKKKYQLLPNSKLLLIQTDKNKIGIYKKSSNDNQPLRLDKSIFQLSLNDLVSLEEIPSNDKNHSNLIAIHSDGDKNNRIELFKIDLKNQTSSTRKTCYSTICPVKVTPNYYKILDHEELAFVDQNLKVYPIEEGIRLFLGGKVEINRVEIQQFCPNQDPTIFELLLEIETIETLHLYLKLDQGVSIYKTFYSEMCNRDYIVNEEYLDKITLYFRVFIWNLSKHPLINEIKYIREYQKETSKNQQTKIRRKMRKKILISSNNMDSVE